MWAMDPCGGRFSVSRRRSVDALWHPFRMRILRSGGPGVSLRSTPGYALASLRDGGNAARMHLFGMRRFESDTVLASLRDGRNAARMHLFGMRRSEPDTALASLQDANFAVVGSGGVAALNPRLRSGIPSGWRECGPHASLRDAIRQLKPIGGMLPSNPKG